MSEFHPPAGEPLKINNFNSMNHYRKSSSMLYGVSQIIHILRIRYLCSC